MLLYRDLVNTLSERITVSLDCIEVGHNFEYGVEFEIALCEALRAALPDQYGIARGYAVDQSGSFAGDDIVIYARDRFPTLAMRRRDEFGRKEFIPIEAVYCYIEAKHTVYTDGDGPQSLRYAFEQVSRVKALCAERLPVNPNQIGRYTTTDVGINSTPPPDYPIIMNPPFGVVFARNVRKNQNSARCCSGSEVEALITGFSYTNAHPPDIAVLGDGLVVVPALTAPDGSRTYRSPFFIKERSVHAHLVTDGLAFGIGFASVLSALDWMQLGVLPWHKILIEALGIPP